MNTVFTPTGQAPHPHQSACRWPYGSKPPTDGARRHARRSQQLRGRGGAALPTLHRKLSRAIPSTLGNAQGHCSARRKFPVRQSASSQQQNKRRAHGRPSGIRLPKDRGIRICQRISRRQSACPPRGWRVSLVHWHQQHRRASGSECSGRHARLCRRIECIRRRLPRPPPSLPSRSRGSAVR